MLYKHIYIKTGPVCIEIKSEQPLKIENKYKQFFYETVNDTDDIIICSAKVTDSFDAVQGKLIYQNGERLIFDDNGKETRIHFFNGKPYGIYRETADNRFNIEVTSATVDILFIEMFALEKYLLKRNALILHSSFIEWNNKGIVFTAPSGTGKSTQASLWEKYENALIINGDRSIIWFNDENRCIEVMGLPFCGSSSINLNKKCDLKAIVFISQAQQNKAYFADKAYASQKLFKETSINKWNIDSIDESLEIISKIIDRVSLISLECRIDQEAVNVLKKLIE